MKLDIHKSHLNWNGENQPVNEVIESVAHHLLEKHTPFDGCVLGIKSYTYLRRGLGHRVPCDQINFKLVVTGSEGVALLEIRPEPGLGDTGYFMDGDTIVAVIKFHT